MRGVKETIAAYSDFLGKSNKEIQNEIGFIIRSCNIEFMAEEIGIPIKTLQKYCKKSSFHRPDFLSYCKIVFYGLIRGINKH